MSGPLAEALKLAIFWEYREVLLKGSGTIVRFVLNQVDVAKVTFDKEASNGIAAET